MADMGNLSGAAANYRHALVLEPELTFGVDVLRKVACAMRAALDGEKTTSASCDKPVHKAPENYLCKTVSRKRFKPISFFRKNRTFH